MRVKTDAKRRALLAAAGEVFHEHGFERASMDEVCARAGGSKATLYRYFQSKEHLFLSVMFEVMLEHADQVFDTLRPSDDLRRTLVRFGASLLELSLSEQSLAVRRNAIAEGARSGVGVEFYERGAKHLWSRMAGFFAGEIAASRLRPADTWRMAMHLRGLLEADLVNRALVGAPVDRRRRHLKEHAVDAVDVFLRAYGQTENGRSARATPPSTGIVAPTT